MKVIIQIPCLDEERTLPSTLAAFPRQIPGVDCVEWLVVDDGSVDRTVQVAMAHGVHHIVRHSTNQGLGRAFRSGLDAALKQGADIIVNTDGDGQYCGEDIPALIAPILSGEADIVIGDRETAANKEFSLAKKFLQWLGSTVVRTLSSTDVPDAVSGFRAISQSAALRLNILSKFSYTVEMIIQASNKQMSVVSVPVRTNPRTRESRLFRNTPLFITQQLVSMMRMYAMYRPVRFFFYLGFVFLALGLLPTAHFFLNSSSAGGGAYLTTSLMVGAIFLFMAIALFFSGVVSDLISQNRQLVEIALEKVRQAELRDLARESSSASADSDKK